jgi:hypothetical protein
MTSNLPDDPPQSPVLPVQLSLDDKFQFHCHKGIACFNKCCENIDNLLTPFDIIRLKNHFGITSRYQKRKALSSAGRAEELANAQDQTYESLSD